MSRLKVACVGPGGIAARHLAAMSAQEGVEIVGVASRSEERAAAMTGRFGGRPFTDVEAMFDETRPDALVICVIPSAHGAIERAAIERRIPFLVEKPLATDWETASAIADAVRAAGLMTSVGYHMRYATPVERAAEILAGKQVAMVEGWWLGDTPPPAWWSQEDQSGGQLVEQTTHIVDLARHLVGEATRVRGIAARAPRPSHGGTVAEVSSASVEFASGAIGTFNSTCILARGGHHVGLNLYADGLALEITPTSLVIDTGGQRRELRAEGDPIAREGMAFLAAVRSGDASGIRSTYADALRTHRLTTLAAESARTGAVLAVPS